MVPTAEDLEYRKLLPSERKELEAHLLRLDDEDRQLRFFRPVSDEFIAAYCEGALGPGSVMLGCFVSGVLRAVGELHHGQWSLNAVAEAAISVEKPWQDHGIGTELLRQLISLARNRAVSTLHLVCLRDNDRMRRITHRLGGMLSYAQGEVEARIEPSWPTYWTLMDEAIASSRTVLHAWRFGLWAAPRAANDAARESSSQAESRAG